MKTRLLSWWKSLKAVSFSASCFKFLRGVLFNCVFQVQFENFLKKLAVNSLKMTMEEYEHLREDCNQECTIDELQNRSLEKGLSLYNLKALKDSLLRDQEIASRAHQAWQPPEVCDLL